MNTSYTISEVKISFILKISLIFLLVIFLFFVLFTIDKSLVQFCITSFYLLLFTLWGHIVIFPLYYKKNDFFGGLVWGSVAGIAIASFLVSIIVYFLGWNLLYIFIFISVLPAIILLILLIRARVAIRLSGYSSYHITLFIISLLLVTLFFSVPYKNLGALVEDKHLYAWLFGHDFIIRMVNIETLSRGIPLQGMFFSGEKMSYYWLGYIFPALLHNMNSVTLELKQLLQITQLFYSFLAIAALFLFLKNRINEKKFFMVAMVLALCCYSYVWILNFGIEVIVWISNKYIPFPVNKALTEFTGFSHGLYRFFLVEPQSTLAIAVMLMILNLYDSKTAIYGFILVGILLGLLFGIEATNAIMMIFWFGGIGFYYFVLKKHGRFQILKKHSFSILSMVIIIIILFSIEMYSFSTGKGALQLSPNWFAIKNGLVYFPLFYGPSLILGFAGIILLFKNKTKYDHWVYHYILLLVISLFFVFFIQNPLEYHFGLLKASRIIPICLLMLTVFFLQNHHKSPNLGKGIVLLIVLALPSLFTDFIIASDIKNPSTFVRSSDMNATKWIRENIAKDAIVQAEPNYPGEDEKGNWPKYAYSLIPIFAERITAVGEWKASRATHNKPEIAEEGFHKIQKMFSTSDLKETIKILKEYDISYIYVGELESSLYKEGVEKFKTNTRYFEPVYHNNDVSIYYFKNPIYAGKNE